jgi:hypothetical protein
MLQVVWCGWVTLGSLAVCGSLCGTERLSRLLWLPASQVRCSSAMSECCGGAIHSRRQCVRCAGSRGVSAPCKALHARGGRAASPLSLRFYGMAIMSRKVLCVTHAEWCQLQLPFGGLSHPP